MLIMSFIQSHHLLESCSSFTEQFYGLKRVYAAQYGINTPRLSKSPIISRKNWIRALMELVLYPTLLFKLDDAYQSLLAAHEISSRPLVNNQTTLQKVKQTSKELFIAVYPNVRALEGFIGLFMQFAYIYNVSNRYSPWQLVNNYSIVRMTSDDYV